MAFSYLALILDDTIGCDLLIPASVASPHSRLPLNRRMTFAVIAEKSIGGEHAKKEHAIEHEKENPTENADKSVEYVHGITIVPCPGDLPDLHEKTKDDETGRLALGKGGNNSRE